MSEPDGHAATDNPVPFVAHLIAGAGGTPRVGLAYDYLMAGDGVFLATENPALALRVPVAPGRIRGLPPVGPRCDLVHGPIPRALWDEAVGLCRRRAERGEEYMTLVTVDRAGCYRLVIPRQEPRPHRVDYEVPTGHGLPLLHLHSHHHLPAFFSRIDDADEQGLGLYGVIGRLDRPEPEVALRAGAYGHWLSLRWADIFAGDTPTIRDLAVTPGHEHADAGTDDGKMHGGGRGDGERWHDGPLAAVALLARLAARGRMGRHCRAPSAHPRGDR
jgi:PRTRC genetic system protein A